MEPPHQPWAVSKLGHERSTPPCFSSTYSGSCNPILCNTNKEPRNPKARSRNHHRARPHRGKQKCKSSEKKGSLASGTGMAHFKDSVMTQPSRSLLLPSQSPTNPLCPVPSTSSGLLIMPTAGHNRFTLSWHCIRLHASVSVLEVKFLGREKS